MMTRLPSRAARRGALAAGLTLVLAACGGMPAPRAELGAAEQAIQQARAAQAAQYAPAELRQAEQKFMAAQTAIRQDDNMRAGFLAEQARTDAELAAARAERERNQTAAEEMRRTLDALGRQVAPPPSAAPQPMRP